MLRRVLPVLLVATGVAHAQPRPEFQAGVDAFRLGKYDEARKHLEAARAREPRLPGPHRFLAAVAQAQARWDDCITSARTAIELNPRSSEIFDTRKLHDDCRASAGRASYRGELADSAAIAVTTSVAGATVKINGLTYGGTPLAPRPITAGMLDVEITKPGYRPVARHVNALAGIVTDVAVELEPDPTAAPEVLPETSPKKPRLQIKTIDGAEVLVDGKPLASDRVDPGTYLVEVRAPGHDLWRRRVRVGDAQNRLLAPALVVTDEREVRRRRGFYLLGGGSALLVGGAVAVLVAPSDGNGPLIGGITSGVGLVTASIGTVVIYRNRRGHRDGAPPFAIAPLRGGALIVKALAW